MAEKLKWREKITRFAEERWYLPATIAYAIALASLASSASRIDTEVEINYLTDCSKRLPEVCLDKESLDTANSAYLLWQEPDRTVKNNITHRNSYTEESRIGWEIGANRIIIMRSNGEENVSMMGFTSSPEAAIIVVNPGLDHYFSVNACSAPGRCVPSQEILIPAKK